MNQMFVSQVGQAINDWIEYTTQPGKSEGIRCLVSCYLHHGCGFPLVSPMHQPREVWT